VTQVRTAVTSLLTTAADAGASSSTVTPAAVAERVVVSPRTLQRRLRADGTTLRRIVGEVRVELARELLMADGLTVEAVATRLGFHDAASFRRAFKRSTGTTPGGFLESARRAAPAGSSTTTG
jgi:transcriptional regulator GlxA family with amidase domain